VQPLLYLSEEKNKMNIKKYIITGTIFLAIFGPGANICSAESTTVTVNTPALDYYWNNSAPANKPSGNPDSGWQHALDPAVVTINYNIGIKNTDTGANISCGSSVPSGTKVTLTFPAQAPTDISWVGTGYSSDSPNGSWVAGAAPTSDITCQDKDFTNVSTQCQGPWGVFISLVVSPPTMTITDGNGTSCADSSACGIDCGALSGDDTVGYSMDCILTNPVNLNELLFKFSSTNGQFYYRYSGLPYTPGDKDYNCSGTSCVYVGNNSGIYADSSCDNSCGGSLSYSCQSGACTDVGAGNGTYADSSCGNTSCGGQDYSCSGTSCQYAGYNQGQYTSSDCDGTCSQPENNYGCQDGSCVYLGAGGTFPDSNCGDISCAVVEMDYGCDNGSCIYKGNGTGNYSDSTCSGACTNNNGYDCANDGGGNLICTVVAQGEGNYSDSNCSGQCSSNYNSYSCLNNSSGNLSCQFVSQHQGNYSNSYCSGICPDRSNLYYDCLNDSNGNISCQNVGSGNGSYADSSCSGICPDRSNYNYDCLVNGSGDLTCQNVQPGSGSYSDSNCRGICPSQSSYNYNGLTGTKFITAYYNSNNVDNNKVPLVTDIPTTVTGGSFVTAATYTGTNQSSSVPGGCWGNNVPLQTATGDQSSGGCATLGNHQGSDYVLDVPEQTITCPINVVANPACGSANKTYTAGSTDFNGDTFCTTGDSSPASPDFPTIDNPTTTWTCPGYGGGETANCRAVLTIVKVNGSCGTANKAYPFDYTSFYGDSLCANGTPSPSNPDFPTTSSPVTTWTCLGSGGGTSANCTATLGSVPVDGICGYADGVFYTSEPTDPLDLCYAGTPSSVSGNGPWNWTCHGLNGGANPTCTALGSSLNFDGTCGPANGSNITTEPTDARQLCDTGYPSDVLVGYPPDPSGNGPWAWICWGLGTGGANSCSTYLAIDGVCGSADGASYNSTPTDNLCSKGTPYNVTGSGPWTWTCTSPNEGNSSKTCTANVNYGCNANLECVPGGQVGGCDPAKLGTDCLGQPVCGYDSSNNQICAPGAGGSTTCTTVGDCSLDYHCDGQQCVSGMGDLPCDFTNPVACMPLYHCDNGSCIEGYGDYPCDPNNAGSDCRNYCEGSQCVINGSSGVPCTDSTQCQSSGYCGFDSYGNPACMTYGSGSICTTADTCPSATFSAFNLYSNYCGDKEGGEIQFNWYYSNAANEKEFQIQFSDASNFGGSTFSRTINSNTNSILVQLPRDASGPTFDFDSTYWWRVRVCVQSYCDSDSGQGYSDWMATDGNGNALTFTTPSHPYPYPDFSYLSTAPLAGQYVYFTDESTCYDNCTHKWDLLGNGTVASTEANPSYIYSSKGTRDVKLTVCDEENHCCDTSKPVSVKSPLGVPNYKEVSPF